MKKAWYLFPVAVLPLVVFLVLIWLADKDRITLSNQTGSDPATVLLDGHRTACDVDDEIYRGPSNRVGNMKPDPSCISEVATLAIDNAMELVSPVTTWTSAATDLLTVPLHPLLNVPLTVWVLTGLPNDPAVNASRADAVYNSMQGGVSFYNVDVRDYHSQTSITDASCEDLQALKRTYPPVDSRLNAYYLQTVTRPPSVNGAVGTATGRWCENDPNIILVGSWQAETLAHELGHALSLKHSNAWAEANSPPPPPGSAENLMIDSSISRSTLTTGQVFRINVDDSSRLNKNGVRTGTARPCPDSQTSTPRCPAVTFDVQPK